MNIFLFRLRAICCTLFIAALCYGQGRADSLLALASKTPDNAERCRLFLMVSQHYQVSDPTKAALYEHKALSAAAQTADKKKQLHTQLVVAKHYLNTRAFDKARVYTEKARRLVDSANRDELATIGYYSGCIYLSSGDTKKALDDFIRSYKLAAESGDQELQAHVNASFGVIYQQQNKLDSALTYYQKSLAYFDDSNNEYTMTGLQNIGGILLAKASYGEGQAYLKRALGLARQRGDLNAEMIILGNIANGYEREGKLALAEQYASELVTNAQKTGMAVQILYGKTLLSTVKFDQKQYDEAIQKAKEALLLAEKTQMTPFIVTLYEMLVSGYEQKGDYRQAYDFKNRLVHVKDSLSAAENNSYIEEIKQRYNLQQKNKELQLTSELLEQTKTSDRQKTVIIISLIVLVVTGIVTLLLLLQRRKIREELTRKNQSLENQNRNFEAFINGQEQERKRIASDLHDGLAQHMVMLKLGIQSLAGTETPQQEKLNHYLMEIDSMIEETRKISHNMMPGVLVDFGLLKALRSLVADLNVRNPNLDLQLESNDDFIAPAPDVEIQLYRIAQELLNNVLKHAGANRCRIRLNATPSLSRLEIEDNGKGFVENGGKPGIGLQNIQSRVDSLQGKLQIESVPGKGTRIMIEIMRK